MTKDPTDEEPEPAASSRSACTVLIVDDDRAVLRLVKSMIAGLGYRVLAAECGADALRLFDEHGPASIDLVLTDIMMPEMDGIELVTRLSQQSASVSVVFMSGAGDLNQAARSHDGALTIAKPFTTEQLAALLTLALSGSS